MQARDEALQSLLADVYGARIPFQENQEARITVWRSLGGGDPYTPGDIPGWGLFRNNLVRLCEWSVTRDGGDGAAVKPEELYALTVDYVKRVKALKAHLDANGGDAVQVLERARAEGGMTKVMSDGMMATAVHFGVFVLHLDLSTEAGRRAMYSLVVAQVVAATQWAAHAEAARLREEATRLGAVLGELDGKLQYVRKERNGLAEVNRSLTERLSKQITENGALKSQLEQVRLTMPSVQMQVDQGPPPAPPSQKVSQDRSDSSAADGGAPLSRSRMRYGYPIGTLVEGESAVVAMMDTCALTHSYGVVSRFRIEGYAESKDGDEGYVPRSFYHGVYREDVFVKLRDAFRDPSHVRMYTEVKAHYSACHLFRKPLDIDGFYPMFGVARLLDWGIVHRDCLQRWTKGSYQGGHAECLVTERLSDIFVRVKKAQGTRKRDVADSPSDSRKRGAEGISAKEGGSSKGTQVHWAQWKASVDGTVVPADEGFNLIQYDVGFIKGEDGKRQRLAREERKLYDPETGKEVASMYSQVFYALFILALKGIRHNDVDIRNVAVEPIPQPAEPDGRSKTWYLKVGEHSDRWRPVYIRNPRYLYKLIDFEKAVESSTRPGEGLFKEGQDFAASVISVVGNRASGIETGLNAAVIELQPKIVNDSLSDSGGFAAYLREPEGNHPVVKAEFAKYSLPTDFTYAHLVPL